MSRVGVVERRAEVELFKAHAHKRYLSERERFDAYSLREGIHRLKGGFVES